MEYQMFGWHSLNHKQLYLHLRTIKNCWWDTICSVEYCCNCNLYTTSFHVFTSCVMTGVSIRIAIDPWCWYIYLNWSTSPTTVPTSCDHYGVIKWKQYPRYWPFVRGTTGHRWNTLTKASDVKFWCFLWSAPGQNVKPTIDTPVVWDAIALIITSL